MKNYTLVNPQIQGSMEIKFQSKSPREAALKVYNEMSKHFSNNVPELSFSLRQGNDLHHFRAKEKVNGKGDVKFSIKEISDNINEERLRKFIDETKDDLVGGKYYDDSSDSDSSDFDSSSSSSSESKSKRNLYEYYRRRKAEEAIYSWKYYPGVYSYPYYYVPQFIDTLGPYVYIKVNDY